MMDLFTSDMRKMLLRSVFFASSYVQTMVFAKVFLSKRYQSAILEIERLRKRLEDKYGMSIYKLQIVFNKAVRGNYKYVRIVSSAGPWKIYGVDELYADLEEFRTKIWEILLDKIEGLAGLFAQLSFGVPLGGGGDRTLEGLLEGFKSDRG